jgi:hypothetical protein
LPHCNIQTQQSTHVVNPLNLKKLTSAARLTLELRSRIAESVVREPVNVESQESFDAQVRSLRLTPPPMRGSTFSL